MTIATFDIAGSESTTTGRDPATGVIELAAELVQLPSFPGRPRQEEAVAFALASWLARAGLAAELHPLAGHGDVGRPNLVCTLRGKRPGPHLVLCGHTDTVPLNADRPGVGFCGEVDRAAGVLRGRGAVDMKGALAAMAGALAALAADGLASGAVTLAAVVDEEMESLGAEQLVRDTLPAIFAEGSTDLTKVAAIVGEPTGNRLCRGHKGLEWLEIELVGRAAHGGTPHAGINAINAAGQLLARFERDLAPQLAARRHPLLGPPTLNVGTISGGDQPSTVAARCVMTFDRRTVPGETYSSVIAELEALLAAVRADFPGLTTRVGRLPGGMATLEHLPLLISADHPLVLAVDAARVRVGLPVEPHGAFPAWTDGALLAGFGRVPTLVCGPGDLAVAHGPDEVVPLAELATAARLYAAAARLYTEAGGSASGGASPADFSCE